MKRSTGCNKGLWLLSFLCLPLVALAGCASGGKETVLRTPNGPAMALASALYERGASLETLAARGGATYSEGQQRHYFKFEALLKKPGQLLFTALDPAGRPAFRLASDGQTLRGIVYGSNQYFSGPATAENFGRFLPLGLSPEELTTLLTGSLVRPVAAGAGNFDGRATELLVVPSGGTDDESQLWRLKVSGEVNQNPQTAALESAAFGPARRPQMALKYANIKNVTREDLGGRLEPFPHSIEAQWGGVSGKPKNLRVTYNEIRLGLPLDEDLFSIPRPENFQLIELY